MNFIELAKKRYSVRKFSDRKIEKEKLDLIIEAGRIAPTAKNLQPQLVYVIESEEGIKKANELSPCIYGAPVVLMICYDKNVAATVPDRDGYCFGETDAAIVCTHMMLGAADLGIGSCWVGRFDPKDAVRLFDLPENICPIDLLPIVYPEEDAVPSPRHESYRDQSETVSHL